ncbi:MAG: hypothetical protein ACKO24_10615 [Leptolyngbyaceae cyanobacterium]
MQSPILENRLRDLVDHLSQDQELLKDLEDALRLETHPIIKSRYRREIEALRESAHRYRQEYNDLSAQLAGPFTPQVQQIGTQLSQMDQKLDWILGSQSLIYQQLTESQQALLAQYPPTQQQVLEAVVSQLNQAQTTLTQRLLAAIDQNELSETDVQQMWAVLEERLPELPPTQAKVVEIVKDPALDAKHKIKVSLPIVPLLVNYEGEFELGTGFNLKAAWQKWVNRLSKAPKTTEPEQPLWELMAEFTQNLTATEVNQIPGDGAAQHDHYIYGTPKRPL